MAQYIFDGNDINAGIFLGAAIHDTAQVSAAGLIYQETFLFVFSVIFFTSFFKLFFNYFNTIANLFLST